MAMSPDVSAEDFNGRVFEASLAMMDVLTIYIGDRLGYYRALAKSGPMSSSELAVNAGTSERHTREWLEQQTITGILSVDDLAAPPSSRRYSLSPGPQEVLTSDLSLAYLTPLTRMLTAAADQMPAILNAHRHGGGVSWEEYGPDMRDGQGEMNRPYFANLLGAEWFPAVPEIHDLLIQGARVAEIGFGHGWAAISLAAAYPDVTVDGYDIDAPSVEAATRNARDHGVSDRVRFHLVDASEPPTDQTYDLVTAFECIHDVPHPVEVLSTMRMLAGEDGLVVVMDERVAESFGAVGDDVERFMYGFSNLVCLLDGLSHEGSAGTGTVMRPSLLGEYARQAGFGGIEILPIEADFWRFYRVV